MLYAPSMTSPDVDEDELADLLALRRALSDEELKSMMHRLKPVVRGGGELYEVDVKEASDNYLYQPQLVGDPVDEPRLLFSITTLHPFSNCYRIFCPTPADVFAMMSSDASGMASFFEIIGPESEADLERQMAAVKRGFHAATTNFYA